MWESLPFLPTLSVKNFKTYIKKKITVGFSMSYQCYISFLVPVSHICYPVGTASAPGFRALRDIVPFLSHSVPH